VPSVSMIVTYDIGDDRRRARVSALLSAWGDRIERSVFECRIESEEVDQLVSEIDAVIHRDHDAVHFFRQCARCDADRVHLGQADGMNADPYWVL